MYRALYRKWRPATFADVVGQESIVTALQSQLLHDRVGHAYLFTGTRGTGKTTCAKIFAKAVNCETRNGADPCCQCSTCTGIETGAVMDVVEIDAASNNGVDNIRDLRDETAYTPSVGLYKVYIIDEVHMLSTAAFNALLKIMEEPPSHVIFILATTEIHKVPATILSRCQRYDFVRIAPPAIAQRLLYISSQESLALTHGAAELIARLADGALRDALSILDTCAGVSSEIDEDTVRRMAGVTDKAYLFALSDSIALQDVASALAMIAQLREKSIDIKRLCDELVLHYRNVMLAGISGGRQLLSGVSADNEEQYVLAAQHISQASAIRAVKAFCLALDKMGKSADARIELELAVFELCDNESSPFVAQTTATHPALAAQGLPYGQQSARAELPAQAPLPSPPQPKEPQPTPAANDATQDSTPHVGFVAPATTHSPAARVVATADLPWHEDAQGEKASFTQTVQPVFPAPQTEFGTMELLAEDVAFASQEACAVTQPALTPPPEPVPARSNLPVASVLPTPTASQAAVQHDTTLEPFALWDKIIAAMEPKDKMLFVNMRNSKAYFDGKRVRIDGSDLFLEYMRRNKYSSALIREVIEQVSGRQYPIGPCEKTTQATTTQSQTAEQALAHLEEQGVQVEYQD